jgi:hypothetical protein
MAEDSFQRGVEIILPAWLAGYHAQSHVGHIG